MMRGSQKRSDGTSNHLLAFLLSLSIQPISDNHMCPSVSSPTRGLGHPSQLQAHSSSMMSPHRHSFVIHCVTSLSSPFLFLVPIFVNCIDPLSLFIAYSCFPFGRVILSRTDLSPLSFPLCFPFGYDVLSRPTPCSIFIFYPLSSFVRHITVTTSF
jgi:hypothetical protein